jgi:23S rRNA (adenine-N6)-dimethyltransferase
VCSSVAVRRAQRAPQPRRSQHFLRSSALAAELVRLAGVSGDDLVLEVGAGEGVITAELARRAGYVVALEIDHALACRLKERFGPGSAVLVVEGDAYRQSLPRLPFRMVSNVPFDSTTRLLRLLLDDPASRLERAALIVQWGFAVKRTRRRPSTLLGLSWAPWWELSVARRVPAKAFRPAPSVDAGVLVVARRSRPLVPRAETDAFRALLRRSFSAGLRPLLSSRERKRLGIPRGAAPRDLGLEEWLAVYCFLRERGRT